MGQKPFVHVITRLVRRSLTVHSRRCGFQQSDEIEPAAVGPLAVGEVASVTDVDDEAADSEDDRSD